MRWILTLIGLLSFLTDAYSMFPENCIDHKTIKASTSISGKVDGATGKQIGIQFYKDNISYDQEFFNIPIDIEEQFSMNFILAEPTIVHFSFENNVVQLYIEPGDDLFLNFDGQNFAKTLKFSQQGAEHNRFLYNFSEQFKSWNAAYVDFAIEQRNPWNFRRFMDDLRSQQKRVLKDKPNRDKFSPNFTKYIYAEIDYWWAYHLLRYRTERELLQRNAQSYPIDDNYFNFLNEVLISNDDALINKNYLFFLDQYHQFQQSREGEDFNAFVEARVKVVTSNIIVMASPDNPPVIAQVEKNDYLKYLNKRSDFKSSSMIGEEIKEYYWYKVTTITGAKGWVLGGGIEFEELNEEYSSYNELFKSYSTSKYKNVGSYLRGKALFHTIASDLYWRSHLESAVELKEEAEFFLKHNPYEEYSQIVNTSYQLAKLSNPDYVQDSYEEITEYRIMEEPAIISKLPTEEPKRLVTERALFNKAKLESPLLLPDSFDVVVLPKIIDWYKEQDEKELPEEVAVLEQKVEEVEPEKTEPKKRILPTPVVQKTEIAFVDIDNKPVEVQTTEGQLKVVARNLKSSDFVLTTFEEPILFQEMSFKSKIYTGKETTIDFNLAMPTIGRLSYEKDELQVYLEPGDKLACNFDATNMSKTIRFSGKGAAHNNYLVDKLKTFASIQKDLKLKIKDAKSEEFLGFMNTSKEAMLQHLELAGQKEEFSKAFKHFAKAEINYWYGFNLLNYPWEHPLHHNEDAPLELPDSYYAFLNELPASCEGALPGMNYTYYLDQFFDLQAEKEENLGSSNMELAEKYLIGDPLDYYKAKLFSIDCKRGKAARIGPEIQAFIEACPNETYNNVLRHVYNEAKGLVIGSKAPDFELTDIDGNEVALSDFEGKIVYLDFWATWCSPCIHHINNSRNWKRKYAEKDVVFLYVSLDEDSASWSSYVKSLGLEGVHLTAKNGNVYKSKIAKLYKVKRLPAIFLIDKKGNVVYNSSKSKEGGRLVDRIDHLLLSN